MGATQRATLAVLAATLGGLATRNSFVSEQREEHWLQCSPSRHTALSSRHAGPTWLKTAYEATGLNATTESDTPPSSWRNAPLAFLFADSATPAEATPAFLATAPRCSSRRSAPTSPPPSASRTRCPRRR